MWVAKATALPVYAELESSGQVTFKPSPIAFKESAQIHFSDYGKQLDITFTGE